MVVVAQRLNTQPINQKAVGSNPATFLFNFPSLNVEFLNQILKWWHFYFVSDSKKNGLLAFGVKLILKVRNGLKSGFCRYLRLKPRNSKVGMTNFSKDPKMAILSQLFVGNQEIANLINDRTSF